MNIIFDLDGTLLDSKTRLYTLFQHLATGSELTYSQYWDLKQKKISNQMILTDLLGFSQEDIGRFVEKWMGLIESPDFLAFDTCLPAIHQSLRQLGQYATLHICTARQYRDLALKQLAQFDLLPFFSQVLVTSQRCSKELLIRQHAPSIDSHDWIIGDTGKDIQTGKALNINTCAVLSGFQNNATLLEYGPDLILDSAADFSSTYLASHLNRVS